MRQIFYSYRDQPKEITVYIVQYIPSVGVQYVVAVIVLFLETLYPAITLFPEGLWYKYRETRIYLHIQ